ALYEADKITYDDAIRNADSMNELRLRIKLEGKSAKDKDSMDGLDHLSLQETEEESGAMR
ncbi:MAG: type IV pili twitching motility protein PilT, partial [Gammaproteobacteria bacterium]|nr:type IV pili twitching motility protein PilT [Gammaproteobacteria bacterium]